MNNAIFIRDSYALLPETYPTFEAFLTDLQNRTLPATYPLRPLLENNRIRQGAALRGQCMAPCFLSDVPADPVPVTIHSVDEVYPAQVKLLPMAEYNARLREVVRRSCPGCVRYASIDDTDESLDGHHSEISLNGVCFYRREASSMVLTLRLAMYMLGGSILTQGLADSYFEDLHDAIQDYSQEALEAVQRTTADDGTVHINVACRPSDPLAPLLLHAFAAHIRRVTGDAVILEPITPFEPSPEILQALLSPDDRPALREGLGKYGFVLAHMTWDGQDDGRIAASLRRMENQLLLHALHTTADSAVLMLCDVCEAMRTIRYRTPLLMAHDAVIDVHEEHGSRRYTVSFDMPYQTLT